MSMRGRVSLVALLVIVLGMPGPPLSARNPDASDAPQTSGPLVASPFGCQDDGPRQPNESQGQACSWSYKLLPIEADAGNDFSAYWLQMELDPARGECVKEMSLDIELPPEIEIVSASPSRSSRTAKTRPSTTRLVVDGGGTAPIPGTISQSITAVRGRTFVRRNAHSYSYTWRGNAPHKVVVAIGLQMSESSIPKGLLSTWTEGGGWGWGFCKPMIIRG